MRLFSQHSLEDTPFLLVSEQRLERIRNQLEVTFGEGKSQGMKAVLSLEPYSTFCPDPN